MPTTWLSPRIRFNPDGGVIAMIFTVTQILAMVSTTPTPDDTTPYHVTSDTTSRVTMVTAYINVTRLEGSVWKWSKQEVGRFGSGYVGPAKGELIHIASDGDPSDHTGCHLPFRSTRPDRKLPQPGVPWIALIKRGRCNFETKVDNAYRTNAVGVLVYNDRDSHNLDKMTLATDKGHNAPVHKSQVAMSTILKAGFELFDIPHIHHFFLFPKFKKIYLRGTRYYGDNEVMTAVNDWLEEEQK